MTATQSTEVSSKQFTWSAATRTLVSERSDLRENLFQRIYPGYSEEVGFPMRSDKTGQVIWFRLASVEKDREGDLVAWHFVPTAEATRKNPKVTGVKVVVFND